MLLFRPAPRAILTFEVDATDPAVHAVETEIVNLSRENSLTKFRDCENRAIKLEILAIARERFRETCELVYSPDKPAESLKQ
jgi:hypothetical protein